MKRQGQQDNLVDIWIGSTVWVSGGGQQGKWGQGSWGPWQPGEWSCTALGRPHPETMQPFPWWQKAKEAVWQVGGISHDEDGLVGEAGVIYVSGGLPMIVSAAHTMCWRLLGRIRCRRATTPWCSLIGCCWSCPVEGAHAYRISQPAQMLRCPSGFSPHAVKEAHWYRAVRLCTTGSGIGAMWGEVTVLDPLFLFWIAGAHAIRPCLSFHLLLSCFPAAATSVMRTCLIKWSSVLTWKRSPPDGSGR